jgi:hypothetical protein
VSALTLFGLFAVTAMLACYAFENRNSWFILGFASACVLGSLYGFLQGAWPFALVEAIWAMVALRRWWLVRGQTSRPENPALKSERIPCSSRKGAGMSYSEQPTSCPGSLFVFFVLSAQFFDLIFFRPVRYPNAPDE